ncbi:MULTISPECIES: uroporphyrinogen-III C-methyltransferase [Bacillaceae]|uniref:uroporphyrinogen-III C-methyltransferase n=1 Tax=Evansella alkalicola TaxID=745819 RepID=A0ABS6JNN2_9BACI|nr:MULTISPECIES: uroporphyrinogen-III C-methyltransferase [Bacillaceae]MBU9719872.1 uroporphyrinogen-III C-methyltransferase [Bacillus alkalicola]
MKQTGSVYLVGAGPGDIGLITVKGLEAIKKADVILYDRLANPKLLDFAKPDCELIYCGKLPQRHFLRQESINDLLIVKALEGKTVTRLKGGDPSVFGRVGEEAEGLAEHGIRFEIVPGITSGIAAPIYAGIPVTHREYGTSFAVVTAHDKSNNGQPNIDWEGLVKGVDTIAFYMGVANLPFICENMIKHGKASSTPVILIQWGTFGRQKTLEGTLETIAEKVRSSGFTNPAITLVGDIVNVREKCKWFENQPLFGSQILLARTSEGESDLARQLREQGADVIEYPKWKSTPAIMEEDILSNLCTYDKVLFTSPESVAQFFTILAEREIDIRHLHAEIYVPSVKSKKALSSRGIVAKLATTMEEAGTLLIIGDSTIRSQTLENTVNYGSHDVLITSEKTIDEQFLPIVERMLEEADIDTIIFPSSLSIQPIVESSSAAIHTLLGTSKIVAMGEKTEIMAATHGLNVNIRPTKPTVEELIKSLTIDEEKVLI